ncbi:MAG: hypothetical protein K8F27_13630 [Sulfuricellaceae bacterium]|nr:hypothetical protein [Sulfuricellaceae bacterium]
MLTTIEVMIDKTGHLHCVESGQTIKPRRALLTWLEPDTAHEDEAALAEDWLNPEEDAAWAHLQPGKWLFCLSRFQTSAGRNCDRPCCWQK